ncbi:MAG: hypothetical protein COV91_01810 [Candidatus Taylorbacteria bacterium CG11_big_fil_rev_8_21_14_0_20_46_11]|uniref:Uncharacterized protein n=1 Tax=Candidatus Taylorbacteria bacterium CG11_big_fil_rev_8_21_14_0_20_46_11 TaxID=1975025 RepID=A0A2H0KEP4_9BACT|nr:MAG: hypothetical protein COV91_01810 [Candidatus Taylorbacteria bacterium CG11_big_fil_rev_8_21_14_0_20_46_11]
MEDLLDDRVKQCEIVKILKVDKSTISRELKRKRKNGRYGADRAGKRCQKLFIAHEIRICDNPIKIKKLC